jgi:hypothetical protein
MKSKKGVFGQLGRLVLALALFAVLLLILFGNGLIPKAIEKLKSIMSGVPEIDPQEKELNFFRNNDKQLEFLTNFDKVLQDSLKSTIVKDACISSLPNFDTGFYIDDGNYNLYLDQDPNGVDINIRLTRYAKQDIDLNSKKIEAPVSATILKNAKLCIIKDEGAKVFYDEFNIIDPKSDIPDASQIIPSEVSSIIVSSGIDESKKLERQIGFKTSAQSDYEYHTLFKKKDKSTIYMLRLQRDGVNYICFLPAHMDKFTSCSAPDREGFMDSDCFDSDDSKNTLKSNMGTGLIPSYYICGDSNIIDPYCLCSGTKSGTLCENDFSKDKCDCAQIIVAKYTSLYINDMILDFNLNTISGKCEYNPEGCNYLLQSQPNFLNEIKDSAWQCPTQGSIHPSI